MLTIKVHNNIVVIANAVIFISPSGKGILGGHADGTIVRYTFDEESQDLSKVCH